jgi:hypothetical protein
LRQQPYLSATHCATKMHYAVDSDTTGTCTDIVFDTTCTGIHRVDMLVRSTATAAGVCIANVLVEVKSDTTAVGVFSADNLMASDASDRMLSTELAPAVKSGASATEMLMPSDTTGAPTDTMFSSHIPSAATMMVVSVRGSADADENSADCACDLHAGEAR